MSHSYLWGLFTTLGNHPDNAGYAWWWHTPVGFGCVFFIFVTCLINVFHKGIADCLFMRIYYWCMAIVSLIAMLHVINDTDPRGNTQTIIMLVTVKFIWATIYKLLRYYRTGKKQKGDA